MVKVNIFEFLACVDGGLFPLDAGILVLLPNVGFKFFDFFLNLHDEMVVLCITKPLLLDQLVIEMFDFLHFFLQKVPVPSFLNTV